MIFGSRIRRFGGPAFISVGTAGTLAVTAFVAMHPAAAVAMAASIVSAVTCATSGTTACISATNTNTGTGVAGASSHGIGVTGTGQGNYGVYGTTVSGNGGVGGTSSTNTGVFGQGPRRGVAGSSPSVGVYGIATAASEGAWGVEGTSRSGEGVDGETVSGIGVYGYGSPGDGIDAESGVGDAFYAFTAGNQHAVIAQSLAGTGGDFTGQTFGLVGTTTSSTGHPLLLRGPHGNNLLEVDAAGNLFVHGGYHTFAQTVDGGSVAAFGATTTSPTVEDTGTAALVGGSAVLRLDPVFASSIDMRSGYRVFLTPNGDTRGLFVAAKNGGGFVVREAQGGRSNVSFDYRVVATALGRAGQRMAAANVLFPRESAVLPLTIKARHAHVVPNPQ